MNTPGVLHPPAADLALVSLPITEVAGPMWRIHRLQYEPVFFDTSDRYRFNPVDGTYGVLYCGGSLECCFIETLLRLDTPIRTTIRSVSIAADMQPRAVCEIHFARPLRLVDLTGMGLAHIGAHESLCSGPYEAVRPWSKALWGHPDQPDGVQYRSRHNPELVAAAIFDRAQPHVGAGTPVPLAALPPVVLGELLDRYKVSLRP